MVLCRPKLALAAVAQVATRLSLPSIRQPARPSVRRITPIVRGAATGRSFPSATSHARIRFVTVGIQLQSEFEEDSALGLFDRLSGESELSDAVRLQPPPLEPGSLGSVVDTIAVALSSATATAAAARALVAWLRTRTSEVTIRISGRDGLVGEVRSSNVRSLGPEAIESLVQSLTTSLSKHAGE